MLHSRMKRVAELIRESLGEIIDQRLDNPRIPEFVTVHSVRVSKDLRAADVQVTLIEDHDEASIKAAMKELQKAAPFLRSELGRSITLKYLPELRFHYNPSTRYAVEMENLFREISSETEDSSDSGG